MVQSVECLPCKYKEPSPDSPSEKPGTAAGTCNPSTGEVDTGGFLGLTGQPVQQKGELQLSSMFNERLCLKESCGEQLRKTSSADL